MRAATYYLLVLLIYASLWGCQMFVCNSTHSLIVLTDSYINLYYMIEIILALYYLRLQSNISRTKEAGGSKSSRILNHRCTYQFKRFPLLGSFMNSVFLSALLMYAAIEGIQSCFHAHHLIYEGGKSILLQHKLTYPGLLVGFAVVGILMRYVLNSVHKVRDEQISTRKSSVNYQKERHFVELDCNKVDAGSANASQDDGSLNHSRAISNSQGYMSLHQLSATQTGVVLKSFTMNSERGDNLASVCISVENVRANFHQPSLDNPTKSQSTFRHIISPVALTACAIVVYFVEDDLATEIADAALAILVVVVSYIASYPFMDYAGRILLQGAPIDLDLSSLTDDLKSVSPLVLSVDDLHVWTLAYDSGAIGSCNLLISKDNLKNDREISGIVSDARGKFVSRGIKCSCVQPVLYSALEEAAKKEKVDGEQGSVQ